MLEGKQNMDEEKKMSEKERFDAMMKLAELRLERWKQRRDTDWKVSLTFWALLVGISAYWVSGKVSPLHHNSCLMVFIYLILVLLIVIAWSYFWVRPNFNSSKLDLETCFHFFDHAALIVYPEDAVAPQKQRPVPGKFESEQGCKFIRKDFCQAQVIITLVLAVITFIALVYGSPT